MPNIDEIFRAGLADHEMAPDASGWDKLSKQLTSKEGKVVLPWYYNPKKALLGALVISLMSFTVGYFIAKAYIFDHEQQSIAFNDGIGVVEVKEKDKPLFINPKNKRFVIKLLNELDSQKVIIKQYKFPKNEGSWIGEKFQERENVIFTPSSRTTKVIESPDFLIKSLLTAFDTEKSIVQIIPTFNANAVLNGKYSSQVSFRRTSFTPNERSFSRLLEKNTTDEFTSEKALLSLMNYELKFSRRLGKNIAIVSGLGLDISSLSIGGNQVIYDKDSISLNLENREQLSNLDYSRTYSATMAYIPFGLRLTTKYLKIGVNFEAGGFLQKTLSENRTFNFSDEAFLPLANTWANTVFDETPRLGFYSSMGLDAYLAHNFGLSLDAVIRKRMQPVVSAQGFENNLTQTGIRLGIFYNF